MLFFVLFLVGFYTQTAQGQALSIPDFACGYGYGLYPQEVTGRIHGQNPAFYRSGTIRPVLLFGKFKDSNDPVHLDSLQSRAGILSSTDLLNPDHVGSLAHYFKEISNEALSLVAPPGVAGRWFESKQTDLASYGINSEADCSSNRYPALRDFSEEVIAAADGFIDFSAYDGDDAAGVDLVCLVIPQEFGETCRFNGTIIDINYMTQDAVEVRTVIMSDTRLPVVGVLAHEYGHAMGLPELLDYEAQTLMEQSAGVGLWDVMSLGPLGWPEDESWPPSFTVGPHPYSAWSRAYVGWSPPEKVEADTTGLQIYDVHDAAGKVYQIPVLDSDTEYFLLANRQNTYSESAIGNYYDDSAPQSGLLIWHIDESPMVPNPNVVNAYEEHKHVDLECADGLFSDQGYPSNNPNPVAGGDNLDYLSSDSTYTKDHNGNLGDAGDMWISGEFTPYSNPSTHGYSNNGTSDNYTDDRQDVFSGIAIRNITQNTNGSVSVDVHFIPSGPRDLGVAANGDQTQVTLAWSEPMVNKTAISKYQYSIDETNWPSVDGGADARSVLFDNSTSTTFWVRAVTANENGETAKIDLDRPGTVTLSSDNNLATPKVGDVLTADLNDANGGISGQDWQWERGTVSGDVWTGSSIANATDAGYMLTAADVGQHVRATVSYMDGAGDNTDMAASAATAVVVAANSPPTLTGKLVVQVAENERTVGTYTAGDPDGDSVTWLALTGAGTDANAFELTGTNQDAERTLQFKADALPDFETKTSYSVTLRVQSTPSSGGAGEGGGGANGTQQTALPVQVEITNADDPGMVTLSSTQPEVDEPIRATLTDQDGSVEHVRWSWLYFSSEDSPHNGEPTVVSSSDELIPSGVLMGLRLQARALYADRLGTHQSAESVQTEPVVGRPSAPQNLTATPSDGSLVLAWDAPSLAGYPAFSGYRYRYKATKGTGWLPSATGALVDQTTRPTLEGLTHGKEHTVEVWAVNAQGAGPSATTTATPPSPDTPGRVELTSMRPRVGVPLTATLVDPDAPVRVRRWRWQQSPWYYRSAGDSSLVAPSEARYPELASYEPTVSAIGRRLRAVVDYTDQYGTPSAQSAWTAPVQPGWPKAPALSATAGDAQVALTWTAAADQGAAIIRYQYHRSDKSGKWLDVPGDGLDGHYTVEGAEQRRGLHV